MSTLATLTRGDAKTYTLTASESLAAATSVIFTAKKSRSLPDTKATFQHELGAGITVDGTSITLAVVHNDTKDLTVATTLYCDVQAQWADRGPVTVWEDTLTVSLDTTRELDTSIDIYTTSPSATQNAIDAAAAASTSATAAAVSATAAATSATNAATSATNAATSATAAATSETNASTSATNASSSASAAASSATAAGISEDAAGLILEDVVINSGLAEDAADAASASATAAATSATNAASSASAASTSASAAASSETNAASSASAAAASAVTAANAIASTFKGGIAGASVPATSTAAGDYYRITSAGSSQSKTWTTGDLAIYNGTSGSWTQIPAGFIDESRVLGGDAGRATRAVMLSDGATSNRRFEQTPGSQGAIAGMPAVFYGRIDVPTSNPSADAYLFSTAPIGTTAPASQANSLFGYIVSGSPTLQIRVNGATTGDNRRLNWSAFRTAYSGRTGLAVAIVWENGDTTTDPKVYVDGVDKSSSFTPATSGTAPNWMPTTLDTTKFLSGYNWPAGRFEPFRVCLGSWTAAEVLEWAQTGREPTWCELGTGSAVAAYSSNFTAGVDSWVQNIGDANLVLTGNVDAVSGVDDVLEAQASGANRNFQIRKDSLVTIGVRYELVFDYYAEVGATSTTRYLALGADGARMDTTSSVAVVEGSWQTSQKLRGVSNSSALRLMLAASATSQTVAPLLSGKKLYFKNLVLRPLGPIAKERLQPGCPVATDGGANKIPGLLTSGLTALGDKPERIYIPIPSMTADGFILANQVIVPSDYKLVAAEIVRTSGSGTGTVTIRETSSGGTTVATGTLAANVALTISNAYSAAGKALHLANSSWSSSALTGRLVFERYQ